MWMWLLDSTTQSGKDSCPATTRNAANRSSGETPGSLIWFMCFLFPLFPIASTELVEPALSFSKLVEPILTSVSERVVLTPSCGCRNVAAGFVRYDFYITSSPMWMGSLATSPLMCCMSSVRSSVASGVAGSQEVAV